MCVSWDTRGPRDINITSSTDRFTHGCPPTAVRCQVEIPRRLFTPLTSSHSRPDVSRLQSRLNGQFMLQGGSQEERWDEEQEEDGGGLSDCLDIHVGPTRMQGQ